MEITFTNALISIGILIIVFFFLREVNCWYWKINQRIELQIQTNLLLEKILNNNNKSIPAESSFTSQDLEKSDVNNPEVLQEVIKKYGGNKE